MLSAARHQRQQAGGPKAGIRRSCAGRRPHTALLCMPPGGACKARTRHRTCAGVQLKSLAEKRTSFSSGT